MAQCVRKNAKNFNGGRRAVANHSRERGFNLILIGLALFVMIGMVGLAIDVGRMFVYKSELQAFADNAAMAAISKMDGTQAGVQAANALALTGPDGASLANKVNFDSTTISNVTTGYATSFSGTYDNYATASSAATNNYRFLKVTASSNVALTFLPALPGISTLYAVSASATSGQQATSSFTNGGMLPFAPDAHNQADTTNFGLVPGTSYTLKWPNNGSSPCAGDAGMPPSFPPGSPPSEHGFVDIGEGNSNSNVRDAILSGGYPNANSNPSSLAAGNTLGGVPGNRGSSIFDALNTRAGQDTDDTSTTYAQYVASGTGNDRRVVTVAIAGTWNGSGSNASTPILGFANFFLNTSYSGTSGGICATYIGPANSTGSSSGGTDGTKIYTNVLYQ
jgi:Flp pilus assembly protein TadG